MQASPAVSVRPAERADIDAIARLADEAELFPGEMTAELMSPYLEAPDANEIWLVASNEAGVIGFAYTAPEKLTAGTFNLLAMATSLTAHGSGIGTALVAATEQALVARSGRLLLVETSSQPGFEPTRQFYQSRGFAEVARIPDFWDDDDDKLVYRKDVRQPASPR